MLYTTNSHDYELDTLILDLNGTLTVGGVMDETIVPLLQWLQDAWWKCYLLTGNQRWNAHVFETYWLEIIEVSDAAGKEAFIRSLHVEHCVAIGNARIDIGMFKHAKISIATLQGEWIHKDIIDHVDIIVPSMKNALELLVDTDRFAATMKI